MKFRILPAVSGLCLLSFQTGLYADNNPGYPAPPGVYGQSQPFAAQAQQLPTADYKVIAPPSATASHQKPGPAAPARQPKMLLQTQSVKSPVFRPLTAEEQQPQPTFLTSSVPGQAREMYQQPEPHRRITGAMQPASVEPQSFQAAPFAEQPHMGQPYESHSYEKTMAFEQDRLSMQPGYPDRQQNYSMGYSQSPYAQPPQQANSPATFNDYGQQPMTGAYTEPYPTQYSRTEPYQEQYPVSQQNQYESYPPANYPRSKPAPDFYQQRPAYDNYANPGQSFNFAPGNMNRSYYNNTPYNSFNPGTMMDQFFGDWGNGWGNGWADDWFGNEAPTMFDYQMPPSAMGLSPTGPGSYPVMPPQNGQDDIIYPPSYYENSGSSAY